MKPIKVLVVCATSLATSTMAAVKLEGEFRRRGIKVKIEKGRISDMMPLIRLTKPDIVVATAVVKNKDIGLPVFNGVPLLSGLGLV
jgi:galactitol-specific phosphotransferase system IIB component